MGPSSSTVLFDGGCHPLRGAQVRLDCGGGVPVASVQLGGDLFGAVAAPAGDGHPHAFGREGAGDCEAQAAGGGCHEGGFSADSEVH